MLYRVLYVPKLACNLFSVRAAAGKGMLQRCFHQHAPLCFSPKVLLLQEQFVGQCLTLEVVAQNVPGILRSLTQGHQVQLRRTDGHNDSGGSFL